MLIQYSDQFAFDDVRFDENDMTWCQIFIYGIVNLQHIMIIDDETELVWYDRCKGSWTRWLLAYKSEEEVVFICKYKTLTKQ